MKDFLPAIPTIHIVTLTQEETLWFDTESPKYPKQYYRAVAAE